jgi:galactokinase
MPAGLTVLVIDSGTRRSLATSLYNERRRECEEAVEALGMRSLRDATLDDLSALSDRPLSIKRARHVVTENQRTLDVAAALRAGDVEGLGDLFTASHASYARDFEASRPEIDTLVDIARRTEGVVAARLTGGGWGGCTVNVVRTEAAEDCGRAIVAAYESATGRSGAFWVSEPSDGAASVRER